MPAKHPYYPTDLVLPGYEPLVLPFELILTVFFAGTFIVMVGTWLASGRYKYLSTTERIIACWFMATGIIHFVIEGNVVVNSNFYKDTSGNILNEIWKEYAKADSRYATRDSFIISMEAVTAFLEGPGCFAIVYAMFNRKPWRYCAMILVSLGELYGDVLYYMTCFHEGFGKHSRPEALYLWFYFVAVNFIWIVVPFSIIWWACRNVNAAVANSQAVAKPKRK